MSKAACQKWQETNARGGENSLEKRNLFRIESKTILQYTNCTHCPVKKRVSKASWPTRRSVFAAAASPRISFANDD
ncbi:NAD kinase [Trichinella spiralis]|uniref:NAD kinase n=1 Tax=Trichinella spiralis TaxID=6334 RepID=A0ABR3K7E5_TRISP